MTQTKTPNMTDYEAERRSFHLEVPEYFNFATDVIGKWASDPNKLAMLWVGQNGEERHLTFAHFAERSSRAANAFAALGIKKGDLVLVMLPRIPEWLESVLGLMLIPPDARDGRITSRSSKRPRPSLADPKPVAMTPAWSISPLAPSAIPSATPSPANIGSTCTKVTCTGT